MLKIALQKGYDKELTTEGKTPWASLTAQLHSSKKSSHYFVKVGVKTGKICFKGRF